MRKNKKKFPAWYVVAAFILCSLFFITVFDKISSSEEPSQIITVNSYYGKYDASLKKPGQPSESLEGPKQEKWQPPASLKRPYTIGVSFPHLKDPYWLAVNYGIITEAKRLGVGINLVSAGGYTELQKQVDQVENLAQQKPDGIILASISYAALDSTVAEIVGKGIPVIEVINDIQAPAIKAKALVSFFDMGYHAGEFVIKDASGKSEINVVFLPGPAGSGWAPDTLDGFKKAVEAFSGKVNLLAVKWGDTGKNIQMNLIEDALQTFPNIDYIVGNAVAADAAVGPLSETGRNRSVKVVSTYIIPPLYDKIKKGLVAASPSDLTAMQGQMAVDMMVRILNGEEPGKDFPFRAGPMIPIITADNIKNYPYELLFGKKDFRPKFSVKPKE